MIAAWQIESLPVVVTFFDTALPNGPAMGDMREITWSMLAKQIGCRREGRKDGVNIVLARFRTEPDGRARRLKQNVLARTAIALDIETNKKTGEIPPPLAAVVDYVNSRGWGGVGYTSHNHSMGAPRYRLILPLTREIPPDLPAVEVIAEHLGLIGVLDRSKLGAASVFYLPSADPGKLADHDSVTIDGAPIDAAWIEARAGELQAQRESDKARQREAALAEAEIRRATRIAAGFKPTENLIETIRGRLDLADELIRHGYQKIGDRYLYPQSETSVPGVHILNGSDGVERVYSHHSGDPLAPGNLPPWCRAKAIDVVDVVTILDHGGDLTAALHKLAAQFGIGAKPDTDSGPPPEWDHIPPPEDDGPGPDDEPTQTSRPRRTTPEGEITWLEPVDLFATESTGAPGLGPQHIPAAIWPFVIDTAERMGADASAVALCSVVSCASVVTDDWAVQPKRYDSTWTENPRIWGAIVGDPSILKTPVINVATKPIDKLEAEARKQHAEAMRQWRVDEAQAKQDKTAPPPQPKLDRYMVEGTTPEALSEVLRDDAEAKMRAPAKKVLSRHDEMSEFFGGLDRYKAGGKGGSERGAYLRLYNGGRYTIDRIGRGSFAVPNWSACFLGGVQPGPIQRIAREAADDGLLQRFFYCVPDRQSEGVDRKPNQNALARYSALFPTLTALQPARSIGGNHLGPVVFHADAHTHREDIDALADAMAAMPDTSPRLKAAFGKWRGQFARLCLIFHLIDIADQRVRGETCLVISVIPESTARRVALYMREIVLPHLLRADRLMFSTDQTGHARWIAGYILAKKLERITTRDIVRDGPGELRPPEARREIDAVMLSLVSVGWLEPEDASNPAKGCIAWRVNPAVHTQFAAKAEAEATRRTKARERIAEAVARARTACKAV